MTCCGVRSWTISSSGVSSGHVDEDVSVGRRLGGRGGCCWAILSEGGVEGMEFRGDAILLFMAFWGIYWSGRLRCGLVDALFVLGRGTAGVWVPAALLSTGSTLLTSWYGGGGSSTGRRWSLLASWDDIFPFGTLRANICSCSAASTLCLALRCVCSAGERLLYVIAFVASC